MERALLVQLRADLGEAADLGVTDPLSVDLLLTWRAMQHKELLDPDRWTVLWLAMVWFEKGPKGVSMRLAYQTMEALWRLTRIIFYQFDRGPDLAAFRAQWFTDFVAAPTKEAWSTVPYCETLVAVPCTGLAPLTRVPWPIPAVASRLYWLCQAARSGHGQAVLINPSAIYTTWVDLIRAEGKTYRPAALTFVVGGAKVDLNRNLFYLAMYKTYNPLAPSVPLDTPANLAQEIQISGVNPDDASWQTILAQAYTVWPWAVCTDLPFVR